MKKSLQIPTKKEPMLIRASAGESFNVRLDDASLARLKHCKQVLLHNDVKVSIPVLIRRAIVAYTWSLDEEGVDPNETEVMMYLAIGGKADLKPTGKVEKSEKFPTFTDRTKTSRKDRVTKLMEVFSDLIDK